MVLGVSKGKVVSFRELEGKVARQFRTIMIGFPFVLIFSNCLCQNTRHYVVITFNDVYKVSQHGARNYFWIIPNDSVKSYESELSKLFLSGFTRNNLEECCDGKAIDPFVLFAHSTFVFDQEYLQDLEELRLLISSHRRKLQSITKKWANGQRERITVYATPIRGRFCYSPFGETGQFRTGYRGGVVLPFSSFECDDSFWKTSSAQFILNRDFSNHPFKIVPY